MKRYAVLFILLVAQIPTHVWAQSAAATTEFLAKEREQQKAILIDTGLMAMNDNLKDARELEFTSNFKVVDSALGTSHTGKVKYVLRKPNLLHVTVTSGKQRLLVVSDGKVLTIHEPSKRRYREAPAPDSIVGSLYLAAGLVGVQPRMIDFLWSVDYLATLGDFSKISRTSPRKIGSATCDGVHLVYGEAEWNVWLERSDRRYPCRLVGKRKDQSSSIVQTNTFAWSAKPEIADSTFRFSAPPGHTRE